MFKKFKEKVMDSQPSQRFQQITQTVSDKFQNLDKDENFFSLTEDDNAPGSPTSTHIEPGFSNISLTPGLQDTSNRQRRTSVSSMTSDTSFLPRYDSVSSIYHLQSDLEVSASEIEDNASTSSQIGHLSKEQIYAAFQKSQMRYHKYRGRFTDLANHYKKLEREFTKLKTELETTQERSFRRVRELKEQCELEQKAKAHLESSLRVDLDEKQIQINTLKEKITLLQNGSNPTVDIDSLTKNITDLKQENENLNTNNNEMKAKLIVLQSKESEYKEKIKKLNEDIEKLKADEKENNLKLAQSKMEIHNELLSKEAELSSLQKENESLKKSLDAYETKGSNNTKIEQLQSQNSNLIEKVESLSQKCQTLYNTTLKTEQYKIEVQNLKAKMAEEKQTHDREITEITKEAEEFKEKLFKEKQEKEDIIEGLEKLMFKNKETFEAEIASLKRQIEEFDEIKKNHQDEITKIRENAKQGLISLEELMKKSHKEREDQIQLEFDEKLKSLNSQRDDALDLKIEIVKYEEELKKIKEDNNKLAENLKDRTDKYNDLEKIYLQLKDDYNKEEIRSKGLEKELVEIKTEILKFQAEIAFFQQENAKLNDLCEDRKEKIDRIAIEKEEIENKLNSKDSKNQQLEHDLALELQEITMENEKYKLRIDEQQTIIEENKRKEDELTSELEARLREKTNLEEALKKATKNLEIKQSELEIKENELSATEETLTNLRKEKDESTQLYDELREKLNSECDRVECKNLHANLNDSKENCDKLTRQNSDLERKLIELRDILSETETNLRKTQEELKELKNSSVQIEDLHKTIKEFKQKKEQSEETLREKNSIIDELKKEFDVKVQYVKNLEENLNIIEKREKDLRKEIEQYKIETDSKSKDLVKLENNFADIQKMYSTEKNDIMKQLGELKQVEKKYYNLLDENENLKEQISEIALLQDKLKTLSEIEVEKKRLEEKLILLENNLAILIDENAEIKNKLSIFEKEKTDLEAENAKISNEMEKFIAKTAEFENSSKELQSKYVTLEQDYESLKSSTKLETGLQEEYSNIKLNYENLLIEFESLSKENSRKMKFSDEINSLKQRIIEINEERLEFVKYYTNFQQELISDFKNASDSLSKLMGENEFLKENNKRLTSDYKHVSEENQTLLNELAELKLNIENYSKTQVELEEKEIKLNLEKTELINNLEKTTRELENLEKESKELREMKICSVNSEVELLDAQQSYYQMKIRHDELNIENKTLKNQIEELGNKIENHKEEHRKYENAINELERHQNELLNEKQLLKEEIEELKISPINLSSAKNSNKTNNVRHENGLGDVEMDAMVEKLTQLKSLDITNKATIEFYENEVQKLKNNNEKLHRRLDETLVTLNHCAELSHSTELEYLKNVLYNYMLGKEGLVLAKVIATVCKFDHDQTEEILKKEQQKQTLLAKLGLL